MFHEPSTIIEELKTILSMALKTIDENTSKNVYKNNENQLCFVPGKGGGKFVHPLN